MKKKAKITGFRLPLLALIINASLTLIILFSFSPSIFERQTNNFVVPVTSAAPVQPKVKITKGKPVKITFPQLSLSVDIIEGTYNPSNQSWTLTKDKAQYAVMTALANDYEGNTFIYGHNNKWVFSKLPQLKENSAEAIVTTDNALNFYYRLKEVKDVKPSDVSLFAYQGKPILTVQTCTGSWFQNRHLLIFDFVKVERV